MSTRHLHFPKKKKRVMRLRAKKPKTLLKKKPGKNRPFRPNESKALLRKKRAIHKNLYPAPVSKYRPLLMEYLEQAKTPWRAPLNPSPQSNPEYLERPLHNSIKRRQLPISIREPLEGRPEAWMISPETGERIGIVQLSVDLFNQPLREDILRRITVWQMACRRQGTHKEKGRKDVRGGGRKPWPQKGTGRARHGSIRSPIWKGGGVTFPRTPHDYSYPLPHKIRKLGLKVALSQKLREQNLYIIPEIPEDFPIKTGPIARVLSERRFTKSTLMIDDEVNKNFRLATRNLPKFHYLPVIGMNVYDMLKNKKLVLTLPALRLLEEKYSLEALARKYNEQVDRNIAKQNDIPDVDFGKLRTEKENL